MKKSIYIVLFLICTFHSESQMLDTLREFFKHKYSIDVRLESRGSFIEHELTSVSGIRIGFSFQRKLRLGGGISWLKTDGYSWLNSNVKKDFYITNAVGKTDTISKYLKFMYLSYYVDFVFYKTKHWQLSVPIQAGTGLLWFQQNKAYSFGNKETKYFLFLYEPGITLQYKVFKWVGLGADVAYRFALQDRKKTGEQLSSPSLTFKALFWFDQLFYEVFPNSEITKKYGPSYW